MNLVVLFGDDDENIGDTDNEVFLTAIWGDYVNIYCEYVDPL